MTTEKSKFVEKNKLVKSIVEKIAILENSLNFSDKNEIPLINEQISILKAKLKIERQLLRKL